VPHTDAVPGTCPHCGRELSPWEQVLLSVDRALMCKGCWYRIILDAFDPPKPKNREEKKKSQESK
jgi:DNA-directed RNA polymerase subunit RPC12/RpoP